VNDYARWDGVMRVEEQARRLGCSVAAVRRLRKLHGLNSRFDPRRLRKRRAELRCAGCCTRKPIAAFDDAGLLSYEYGRCRECEPPTPNYSARSKSANQARRKNEQRRATIKVVRRDEQLAWAGERLRAVQANASVFGVLYKKTA
jgi:DeoR/GlpR family transcriptional regulator of sugar metabolism